MASASTSTETLKQIVVIGGGASGNGTAAELAKKVDSTKVAVTLISARPHYTHMPATLRMVVAPTDDLENRALVPLDRVFANTPAGKFKLGKVVEVTKDAEGKSGSVVLEDGEKLHWDYLVVASGSKWEGAIDFPSSKEEVSTHVKSWREKFEKANHIALVGGGAVGVELAGEIKDVYPDKKVTIIHNGKLLLNPTYPDKFRNAVAKTALKRGVQLVLEDSVAELPESGGGVVDGITTAKGVTIPADLVTATRGWTPNTSYLANLPDVLNERGQVKTLPTFQSAVAPHIFALGDVTDFKEQKQLAKIYTQTPIVSSNILSLLQGKAPTSKYGGGIEAIVLTSGKYAGNMHVPFLGGVNMGNWVTSNVKGKGLFVNMQRKALGYN